MMQHIFSKPRLFKPAYSTPGQKIPKTLTPETSNKLITNQSGEWHVISTVRSTNFLADNRVSVESEQYPICSK